MPDTTDAQEDRLRALDEVSTACFYFGAALMFGFIAWLRIAELGLTRSEPSWWQPGMTLASVWGMLFLVGAVGFSTVRVWGLVITDD